VELLLAIAVLALVGGFALRLGLSSLEERSLEAEALRLSQFLREAILRANLERKILTLKFYDSVGDRGAALMLFGPESALKPISSFAPREGFALARVRSTGEGASGQDQNVVRVLPDFRCVPALTLRLERDGRRLYVVVVSATGRVWVSDRLSAR